MSPIISFRFEIRLIRYGGKNKPVKLFFPEESSVEYIAVTISKPSYTVKASGFCK